MKIIELVETEQYKIFVDLDGVLADFPRGMTKAMHATIGPSYVHNEDRYEADREYARRMWKGIEQYQEQGNELWYELELMHDAMKLWEYVRPHSPQILTATGKPIYDAETQKRKWVAEKLGDDVVVNLTRKAAEKAKHAAEHHILIDDKEKAINPWKSAGGIGIVHTSADNTIRELKVLGI